MKSSLRRQKFDPYLTRPGTVTYKLRSTPFVWTNRLMERASLARLTSLLVKFPAYLRLKTSTPLAAIHLSIKYNTSHAVVEAEAAMADVVAVLAPILVEALAVDEEVAEAEPVEQVA